MSMEEMVAESIRIVRAQERVCALLMPLKQMGEQIDDILKIAPELGPELNAVRGRISECCSHMTSALGVIQAKIDLL